ncbi:MAG: RluA family pseudouridine synthase [Planctomycetes bacterium]|nr:RluA family pseudouridine synthase [Planctomycetota bacterium]
MDSSSPGNANRGHVYRHHVRDEERGATVLALYVARFTHTDESTWRARIAEGSVRLNGRVAEAEWVVRAGDELAFHRAPWVEPDAPREFGVVFEDEHVLAIDKPSGLQVLPAGPFTDATLLTLVRESAPDRADASPIHRLGRGTSGVVLFGKTFLARAALAKQFRDFHPRKTYLAVTDAPRTSDFTLPRSALQPIGTVPHGPMRLWVACAGGKPSKTRLRIVARDRAGRLLVAAQPITGRADQIRIHLAACGVPIAGDLLFGVGGVAKSDVTPGRGGYRLHATALAFTHPASGRSVKLRCLPRWSELADFVRAPAARSLRCAP